MAIKKRVFGLALIITVIILSSILFSNSVLNDKREDVVVDRMDKLVEEYEDMQTLMLMAEFFGEEATCVSLSSLLENMNKELWDLGIKIDLYRQATEDFMKDPFYVDQKVKFNRREVLYFSMLRRMKEMCEVNQTIVSFFYKKKEECPQCDAQSFVLSDIKRDLEKIDKDNELAVFSFDANMDIPAISLLIRYYNISEFPAVIVEDEMFEGLQDKEEMKDKLCENNALSIC